MNLGWEKHWTLQTTEENGENLFELMAAKWLSSETDDYNI